MNNSNLFPIVYVTAELKSRDFDSRLLVAAYLLKAGLSVIFGQQWALVANAPTAMPGCFLFKTANAIQARWMKECIRHLIVASDEEALPFAGTGFLVNIAAEAVDACDLFLVQNDSHRRILEQAFPSSHGRCKVAGSPRMDLLEASKNTYGAEAENLRRSIGPYVLFNTGFGLLNSIWGSTERAAKTMFKGAGVTAEEIHDRIINEQLCLDHIKPLIQWTLQHSKVVIRPHPSENAAAWRDEFPVHVIEGSNPVPWMLGAKAVVHSNSTTGIEAAVLGAPCLNVDPTKDWGQRFIIREVNCTVKSAQEAAEVLAEFLSKGKGRLSAPPNSARICPRQGSRKTAQIILDLFAEKGVVPGKLPMGYSWSPMTRAEGEKAKFTVSAEEMNRQCEKVFAIAGTENVEILQLDDSVFLLVPGIYAPE